MTSAYVVSILSSVIFLSATLAEDQKETVEIERMTNLICNLKGEHYQFGRSSGGAEQAEIATAVRIIQYKRSLSGNVIRELVIEVDEQGGYFYQTLAERDGVNYSDEGVYRINVTLDDPPSEQSNAEESELSHIEEEVSINRYTGLFRSFISKRFLNGDKYRKSATGSCELIPDRRF